MTASTLTVISEVQQPLSITSWCCKKNIMLTRSRNDVQLIAILIERCSTDCLSSKILPAERIALMCSDKTGHESNSFSRQQRPSPHALMSYNHPFAYQLLMSASEINTHESTLEENRLLPIYREDR